MQRRLQFHVLWLRRRVPPVSVAFEDCMTRDDFRKLGLLIGALPQIYLLFAGAGIVFPVIGERPWHLFARHPIVFMCAVMLCTIGSIGCWRKSRPPKPSPLVCHNCEYAMTLDMERCPECGKARPAKPEREGLL